MTDSSFFNIVLVWPIINVLLAIYKGLLILNVPYALGFSIIFLTIFIRLVLYPFINTQLKVSKKMQELAPHLAKLKEKHKHDPKILQGETMKLYKEFGVNPAAGCLPMLVQLPVLFMLYSVLQNIITAKPEIILNQVNKIAYFDFLKLGFSWSTDFFGISLGKSPSALITMLPFIILVPVITGASQFVLSKMMALPKAKPEIKKDDRDDKKQDDFASAFQTQSLYIFPIMIGFFSYTLPIGLSLYWNTFTIFGILQQYRVQGLGGLSGWKEKFNKILGK